jgi:plastocyanin
MMPMFVRLLSAAAIALALPAPAAPQPVAVQRIDVANYTFAPRPIRLAAGRPVTLTFVNRSGSGHDFTARAFFASARILAGAAPGGEIDLPGHATRSVTLIPRAGSYQAHCSHFLHKQMGMQDLILVG